MKNIDKSKIKKYIIIFLFICLCFMITDKLVKAETITNMQFSSFRTTASSYNITSNSSYYDTVNEVPVNMGIIATGFAFEWITNYTTSCTGQTVINGTMAIPNVNLDYYWYLENIKEIYYAPNISGVDGTPCTWSVNPNNMNISFSCQTIQPNSNFIIGGKFQYREGANFNTYFRIYRNMNITCDNSANAIIDNNNINTENIINNQNENTDKEIESQKVCNHYEKVFTSSDIRDDNQYLIVTGATYASNSLGISNYITLDKNINYTITIGRTPGASASYCLYNNNNTLISCTEYNRQTSLTFNSGNASYIRLSIYKDSTITLTGEDICVNGNQALNDSINDLNDSLTDTSTPDDPDFGNSLDVSSMTPITDLITMPITLYNKIISESNKSCSSYSIPFGLVSGSNYTLTFPCIDIGDYLGSNLKGIIDDLFCLFMIYEICMLGVTIFNDATSLKDSFDSLYVPRHSSDIPRHGGPVNYG